MARSESVEEDELKLLPSSFKFHDFVTQVNEVRINIRSMKMEDSLYLWIGDRTESKMNDLTVAMISRYENVPVAARLMGTNEDSTSTSLAKRLAKKFGKPIYVSFNVPVSNVSLPAIEKAIRAELEAQRQFLSF